MKLYSYVFYFLIVLSLGFSSCGGGDDGDGGGNCNYNWAVGVQSELTAISNAATAYSTDPSVANCNNYKNALQNYVNALKPFGDCSLLTGADRTSFQNALEQYEDIWADIDCTP